MFSLGGKRSRYSTMSVSGFVFILMASLFILTGLYLYLSLTVRQLMIWMLCMIVTSSEVYGLFYLPVSGVFWVTAKQETLSYKLFIYTDWLSESLLFTTLFLIIYNNKKNSICLFVFLNLIICPDQGASPRSVTFALIVWDAYFWLQAPSAWLWVVLSEGSAAGEECIQTLKLC